MAADQVVSINALAAAEFVQPLQVHYAARFDASVLQVLTQGLAGPATSVDGAPVLTEQPTSVARTYTGADGTAWFVPVASIPATSNTSPTPAVFIDHEPERWVLRVTVDLRRHPAVPDSARPLPIGDFRLALTSQVLAATPVTFDSITDVPSPDPAILRRVVAIATVDQNRVAAVLKEDQSAVFAVTATVHYADPAPAGPGPVDPWPGGEVEVRDHRTRVSGLQRASFDRVSAVSAARFVQPQAFLAAEEEPAGDQWLGGIDKQIVRFPRPVKQLPPAAPPTPAQPTARSVTAALAEGAGITAWYPTTVHANRPIYAFVDSGFGFDPDSLWRMSPAGPWKDTGIPGRYYLLPTEYRLAFDTEQQLPAVNVVLVEQPVADGSPAGSAYRVRVRFKVVPWFDPAAVEALRATIASVEGVTFPEFEVGGDDGATFHSTALLQDLGGGTVTDSDVGLTVDTRGFEYVVEGTLQYYTLLTKLLAPGTGSAAGLDGQVRCTLKASAEDTAPQIRDVPVRLRLDRPATDLLDARLLLPPPVESWPGNWTPPVFAAVSARTALPLDVGAVQATLLIFYPDVRLPIDAVSAVADPGAFALATPDRPVPAPKLDPAPAPPAYPAEALAATDGVARPEIELLQDRLGDLGHAVSVTGVLDPDTLAAVKAALGSAEVGSVDEAMWKALFPSVTPPAPEVGPGEVLVELTPTEPVDPRVIGAIAVSFGGVAMHLDPATVLEKVHELAAAGNLQASLRVRSYQLQHPENLPPTLTDLYALEVQIRRPGGEPVTVFLSRDEPEKTAQVGFTVTDLLGGATPGAPSFEWRRRNQTAAGTGKFSGWEALAGTELFVTPAT